VSKIGLILVVVGITSNRLCWLSNGKQMPVFVGSSTWLEMTKEHKQMTRESKLKLLGDVLWIRIYGHLHIISIGDVLMILGLISMVAGLLR
jgi:hypothetical protein